MIKWFVDCFIDWLAVWRNLISEWYNFEIQSILNYDSSGWIWTWARIMLVVGYLWRFWAEEDSGFRLNNWAYLTFFWPELTEKMLDGRNNDVLRFYSSGHPAKKYTHGIPCDKVTRFTLELSWKIPSALFLNVSQFYEGHCSHFAVYLLTHLMWLFCIPHLLLVAGWWRWWRCCRRGSWSTTSGPSPSLTPWRTSPSHSTPSRRMASN